MDIHRIFGHELRVVVLLEGKPAVQSELSGSGFHSVCFASITLSRQQPEQGPVELVFSR